jgi:hypothetical protein
VIESILSCKLKIDERQIVHLPLDSEIITAQIVYGEKILPFALPDIYLIYRAKREVKNGWVVKGKTETRIIINQRVGSLISYPEEKLKFIKSYSLSFSGDRSIIFCLFELLKNKKLL